MRIGVYVGSFNPIHNGHLKVVNYLLDNNYLDKVIVVPTIEYWNKVNLVSLDKRLDMLKLAFKDRVSYDVFPKLEYTYQILDEIHENNLSDDIYLIIGADNVKNFYKWKNVKDILKYNILVVNRNDLDVSVDPLYKNKFIFVNNFPFLDVSSTYVRELIKCKRFDELVSLLDENVIKYIIDNVLYLEV
jgi:nicotinate-nucleotide adenylyltransferase